MQFAFALSCRLEHASILYAQLEWSKEEVAGGFVLLVNKLEFSVAVIAVCHLQVAYARGPRKGEDWRCCLASWLPLVTGPVNTAFV